VVRVLPLAHARLLHDNGQGTSTVEGRGAVDVSAPVTGPGVLRVSGDGPWKCAVRR
jgi:hypothetical protein